MGLSPEQEKQLQDLDPFWSSRSLDYMKPEHVVRVRPFLVSKYEVSQGTWERIMHRNPSIINKRGDLPVNEIYMKDCEDFCRQTGLDLPTEAQWEYACRAGTQTLFFFGERLVRGQATLRADNPYNGCDPVNANFPNGFGLHNMHGNVAEWCKDYYCEDFYKHREAVYPDPICTIPTKEHTIRGGCSTYDADMCTSAFRCGYDESNHTMTVGIRPVYNLP